MSIAPDDRGFTLGHGLFETLLFVDGRPQFWDEHMARLLRGCAVLGLPLPDLEDCRAAALAAAAGLPRAAVRLSWSAGPGGRGLDPPAPLSPGLTVTAAPAPAPDGPVRLATARVRRNEHSPASRLKTLSYLDNVLARAEARAAGANEALMLNTVGEVACAAAANVFWITGAGVFTPALSCGVLDGIVRGQVLVACRRLGLAAEEVRDVRAIPPGAPVFLTNSLTGLRPVAALDGQPRPPHRLIAALAEAVDG